MTPTQKLAAELDALPLPERTYATDTKYNYSDEDIRAAHREGYELAIQQAQPTPALKRHALEAAYRLSKYAAAPFFPDTDKRSVTRSTTSEWWDGLAELIEEAQPLIARALRECTEPHDKQQQTGSVMLTDAEKLLPHGYLLAKVAMVVPLLEEARDALTAITEHQRRLHGISPTLADRMDVAGTFSLEDWQAALASQPAQDSKAQEGREPVAARRPLQAFGCTLEIEDMLPRCERWCGRGECPSTEWTPYLKDGETPFECLLRHRKEQDGLVTLLAQARQANTSPPPTAEGRELVSDHSILDAVQCLLDDDSTTIEAFKQGVRWREQLAPILPVNNQTPEPVQSFGIIDPDYARVFTKARIIAWSYGFACLAHGSYTRDLDLLLVPWADHACADGLDRVIHMIAADCGLKINGEPGDKPHGRKAWTLLFPAFGDPRWVDVSAFGITSPPPKNDEARDAERYRLLRNGSGWPAVFASSDAPEPLRGEELDAALAAQQKGKK